MAKSCSYTPCNRKGEEYKGFTEYRDNLGYKTAAKVFPQVLSPSFQERYKRKLRFDEQNVPTYESAITTPHIQNVVGLSKIIDAEQRKHQIVDDTRDNYRRLVQEAYNFNASSELNNKMTAVVTKTDKGLRIEMRERSEANLNEFKEQYGVTLLNERLEGMFGDLGITVSTLEAYERVNGRIDLSKATDIANGFKGLISVANGMRGEMALPEEFSHLLISILSDNPLVQRCLNTLENDDRLLQAVLGNDYLRYVDEYSDNPNYDSAGNQMSLNRSLAEEALGKILSERLVKENSDVVIPSSLKSLVNRIVDFIRKLFRYRSAEDVERTLNDIDTDMGDFAKKILNGEEVITKEKVMSAERKAKFNQMGEKVKTVIDILRAANEIERRRYKIAPKEMKKGIKERISTLEGMIVNDRQWEAIHIYAKYALSDLESAMSELDSTEGDYFAKLRMIKNTLDSYYNFIEDMHGVLEEADTDEVKAILGEEIDLRALWRDMDDLYKSCIQTFKQKAFAAFSDFLEPIYEKAPLRNEDGSVKPLKEVLIAQEFDISEFDRWLVSMGNSSSIILQMIDKAVKNTKDDIREKSIKDIRDIWKIKADAEARGIRTFDWIYERDRNGNKTGYYISPYNVGQFKQDEEAMLKALEEKYGKHPVGKKFNLREAEKNAWYEENAVVDMWGNKQPNDNYENPEFKRLSDDKKAVRNDIIEYKKKIERQFPADKRDSLRAIQRRRGGTQRLFESVMNPTETFKNVKEVFTETFKNAEDDDQIFGERTQGLTDFTGKEYMTVPILYTRMLKNPNELSDDIMGNLMLYAHMANTYTGMTEIADPLEIGTCLLTSDQDKFIKGKGGKVKEEVINALGRVSRNNIKAGSNTAFEKKLRDYLECQVYGKYLKDDDVLGPKGQKAMSFMMKLSSLSYLGLNAMSGIANVATAIGMQNIEVAAGEFFGVKELAKADFNYFKLLGPFMGELGSVTKQSELALFDELFDVKQDFKDRLHQNKLANIIRKLFGENWAFLQQSVGDHWIYNRTAIAMAMRRKVKVDGKEMSVWDARQIITDSNGYKRMVINPKAKNLDGTDFSAKEFGREIAHINHTLVGIYNEDDMNAANRVMVLRALQQMRKWIVPQMMRRFQSKRRNMDLGKDEEGYYRTFGRFAVDVWKSGGKILAEWDKYKQNPEDFANLKRAIWEMFQTYSLWVITSILGSGVKDPDRSWGAIFLDWLAHREIHELGFLTPGPMMATEGLKTIQSPAVVLSTTKLFAQAIVTTMWPGNWIPDEDNLVKSGKYEGHTYIYKRWAELPIPPFAQFRQINKFLDDLDVSRRYYARDYR